MPRTRHSLARLALIGALASALALGAAVPAFAFGPATITITPSTTGEDPLTSVGAVCPSPSDSVTITWTGTHSGSPVVLGPTSYVLDGAGEFLSNYYMESFFDRDTDATFSMECFNGAVSTGTDSTVYHLPTTGAVSSAPASLGVNQDLIVTGNCGSTVSVVSIEISAYRASDDSLLSGFPFGVAYTNAADYSVSIGSGTTFSVPETDSITVSIQCRTSAPALHTASNRVTSTLMTAAVTAPPAAAPGAGALASTGTEITAPIAAGGALVIAGALLMLVRRRRSSVRAAR